MWGMGLIPTNDGNCTFRSGHTLPRSLQWAQTFCWERKTHETPSPKKDLKYKIHQDPSTLDSARLQSTYKHINTWTYMDMQT